MRAMNIIIRRPHQCFMGVDFLVTSSGNGDFLVNSFCVKVFDQLHPVDHTAWFFQLYDVVGRDKKWKFGQKSCRS